MADEAYVGFQADPTLIDRDLAMRAHRGTSFDPEKRGKYEIESFVDEVEQVHKTLIRATESAEDVRNVDKEMDKFQERYAKKWNEQMASRSRVFSPMITGGANFPVQRNQNACSAYEKRISDMYAYKERAINSILKKLQKHHIEAAGGEYVIMEKELAAAESKQERMKAVNKILRNKKMSDEDRIKQVKLQFGSDCGNPGFGSWQLSNNNANIKRMKERLAVMKARKAKPSGTIKFSGGTIIDNNEDDRVQIYFDEKPDAEMRSKLKGSGWHWSPSNGVWQRKRTAAAMESAKQIVGAGLSPLQQTSPAVAPEPEAKTVVKPAPTPDMPPILTAPPELAADVLGGGMGAVPVVIAKPKYKVGDWVYSYQNPTVKRPIRVIRESIGGDDSHAYKISLEYGGGTTDSNWIAEQSIMTHPQKVEPPRKELLARAEELGREGFFAGKQAPARDVNLVKLCSGLRVCSNRGHSQMMDLMTAWSKGWHAEHQIKTDKELRKMGIVTPRMEAAAKREKAAEPAPAPDMPPILIAPPELAADVLGAGLTPTAAPKRKPVARTTRKPKTKPAPTPDMPSILIAPPELAADVLGGGMMGLTPTQAPGRKPTARTTRKPKTAAAPKPKKQPKKTAAPKRKTTKKTAKPKAKKTAAGTKLTPSQREYLAIQGFVMVKRGGKYVRITN